MKVFGRRSCCGKKDEVGGYGNYIARGVTRKGWRMEWM
jgi:hypothetical protein